MNRITRLVVGLIVIASPGILMAQPANENIANSVAAARAKDAAMLRQFTWNSRTEINENGTMQDIRLDLVSIGPDGTLQRSLLNDQQGNLPGFFFRKKMEAKKRKELETYMAGLSKQLDEYTLPNAGKVVAFIVTGQVQPLTTPEGQTMLQITGSGVVVPGDTFTLTIDPKTMRTTRMEISTTFNNHQATATATFAQAKGGPNHLQFADVSVPDMNVVMTVHNYDYVQND